MLSIKSSIIHTKVIKDTTSSVKTWYNLHKCARALFLKVRFVVVKTTITSPAYKLESTNVLMFFDRHLKTLNLKWAM